MTFFPLRAFQELHLLQPKGIFDQHGDFRPYLPDSRIKLCLLDLCIGKNEIQPTFHHHQQSISRFKSFKTVSETFSLDKVQR